MSVRLGELAAAHGLLVPPGAQGVPVLGVSHDSRQVEPGDLFVALRGARFEGQAFVAQAVARGAVAVLAAAAAPEDRALPWLTAADPRALLGPLARQVYGEPDRELTLIGVTGTNGKSTVTALVAAMLDQAGQPAGILGTLGYRFRTQEFAGVRTTPEASDLFRILRRMREAGAHSVVMEVSSHALALGRVKGAEFSLGVFTNLSRDHFDFHPDFEHYFAAKRQLFAQLRAGGKAVLNQEDPYGLRLLAELAPRRSTLSYGGGGEVTLEAVDLSGSGSRGVIRTPRGPLSFRTPLVGRYNLLNLLAAVATAESLELPHEAVAGAIAGLAPRPGRLEPVERGQSFPIFIDYAHTDAALRAALAALKELSRARLILVFGCGGDRDPGKRPLMGRVAGELADLPIATSDNPRSEDPLHILAAVEEGLRASGNTAYRIVPDRREAIREAIAAADSGAVVLVAGKGHERMQIFADRQVPFSDLGEIEQALEERLGAAAHR